MPNSSRTSPASAESSSHAEKSVDKPLPKRASTRLAKTRSAPQAESKLEIPVGAIVLPEAQTLSAEDLACTHFALEVVSRFGTRFSLRSHINDVLMSSAPALVWPVPVVQRLQKFLSLRCAEYDPWQGCGELTPQDFMHTYAVWGGTLSNDASIWYYLDEFVKHASKDLYAVIELTRTTLEQTLADQSVRLLHNVDMLSRILGLSTAETWLVRAGALTKFKRDVRGVLVDCKVTHAQDAYQFIAQWAQVPVQQIVAALRPGARLEALGLIDSTLPESSVTDLGDLFRMSDKLLASLLHDYAQDSDLMAVFTKPVTPSTLTLDDYPHVTQDARYLTALLKTAANSAQPGVNVLLYGPPGTGKTQLAKLLAAQSGCELYEVESTDAQGGSLSGKDRYRSLQIAQAFLKGRPNTALLFDEIEDVFPSAPREVLGLYNGSNAGNESSVNGKAWVNNTLENNPVPTVWVSNDIAQIDPAYLRRFQYHLELKNPPAHVRQSIVRKHLSGLEVSEEFIAQLAQKQTLTPAQIASAARFVQLTHSAIDEPVQALIERQIQRADAAMGIAPHATARRSVTRYDVSLLNIESEFTVDRMLQALNQRQQATLCFYGLPGTGKTALAEHIAQAVDRPLLIKRASDLLSKYVGESEQNMARMFAQAQEEKAVLLLDEADSFLQNRQMAQRNYEVSEVNEMLQGMERFEGIFICTTNLLDRIDEAALRRFSFKIKFLPLTREQRERMFVMEALNGQADRLTDAMRDRLAHLRILAPGDFAAVKRQWLLFDEPIDPLRFLTQLEREHQIKPDVRYERKIGFA